MQNKVHGLRKRPVPLMIGAAALAILGYIGLGLIEQQLVPNGKGIVCTAVLLLSSIWAGWDSSRLNVRQYQRFKGYHPVVVSLLCILLWVIAFPLYVANRVSIVSGAEPLAGDVSVADRPKTGTYLARLALFAVACVVLGGVVLFCMFCPSINPKVVLEAIYQPDPFAIIKSVDSVGRRMMFEPDELAFEKKWDHTFTSEDFKELQLPVPEDVSFKTEDNQTIHGLYFPKKNSSKAALLNWSGFGDTRFPAALGYVKMLQDCNLSVLIYDYRGTGKSSGSPSFASAQKDGSAAYEYLIDKKKIASDHIVLMGRQIGAYVACHLNKAHPAEALILEEPWTNVRDWVMDRSPLFGVVPESLYPEGALDDVAIIKETKQPMLVAQTDDTTAPEEIFKMAPGRKAFFETEQASRRYLNITGKVKKKYTMAVADFLAGRTPAVIAESDAEPVVARPISWVTDPDKAFALAKSSKKVVMVDIYTDWCRWCKVLDQRTYSDPSVRAYVNQHCVSLKANAEDKAAGQKLSEKYKVEGFPTILLLNSDGTVVNKVSGFMPPRKFLKHLKMNLDD